MSMETATEQVAIGLLRVAGVTDAYSHDDHAKRESMDGIAVSAKSQKIISHAAGNQNRVEAINLTISIRSLIPTIDPKKIGELWEKISAAILNPTLPPTTATWIKAVPALSSFNLFHCMGEAQSSREDNDTKRNHTRDFVIYASPKN